MKVTSFSLRLSALAAAATFYFANAETIAEINGNRYLSPLRNQNVVNVTGVVTAKGPDGFWIRSTTPDNDRRTSESIYVFSSAVGRNLTTGDVITLDGRVVEYRNNNAYNFLAEITNPTNIRLVSQGTRFLPLVLGGAAGSLYAPPTEQYSGLDNGDVFGVPNNASQISRANPILEPTKYGLDFWESLQGEVVKITKPRAISRPNNFGDTWIVGGNWVVTGRNKRGGLTMTAKDANPEGILIGSPLDGSRNPLNTYLAQELQDITGVVYQAFGFYRILPLTSIKPVSGQTEPPAAPKSSLSSDGSCSGLTVGDYNVENLAPNSTHLPLIAAHIVDYLNSPDLLFLQEIQDDNGPTNDGVVSANQTLLTLAKAINELNPAVNYSFVSIDPINNQDGGQPGGNIRPAYLYNPAVLRLAPNTADGNTVAGKSNEANAVIPPSQTGQSPTLKYNPGLIDPLNPAFRSSRKPLTAQWQSIKDGSTFFTINVHLTSKGGSSSIHDDPRPPVNGGISSRASQTDVTASFISSILSADPEAGIITAGDFNEFAFVQPLTNFKTASTLEDLDTLAGIPEVERYTYLFDGNCQQLDHIYVSSKLGRKSPGYEHIHINTWVENDDVVSDHDPSVAKLNVC